MHRTAAGPLLILIALVAASASAIEEGAIVRRVDEPDLTRSAVETLGRELFGDAVPAARNSVGVTTLFVGVRHPIGGVIPVRVQVLVPRVPPSEIRGVYLFAPGTTGIIAPCRASREHEAGIRWALYRNHTATWAGQGYIGIVPDYVGHEDWNLIQPYYHAESEARVIFAAFRAVDTYLRPELPRGIAPLTRIVAGFSQGGHAAFAAADRNGELGDRFPVDGVIGYGPSVEIEALLMEYPSVAPMLIQAYAEVYGDRVDPALILQSRWAETLEYDTTRQCVGAMQAYYPSRAHELFRAPFLEALETMTLRRDYPQFAAAVEANRAGLRAASVPALVLHGTNDIVVSYKTQRAFVDRMRATGREVEFIVFDGARHDTRQIGFDDALRWASTLGGTE